MQSSVFVTLDCSCFLWKEASNIGDYREKGYTEIYPFRGKTSNLGWDFDTAELTEIDSG